MYQRDGREDGLAQNHSSLGRRVLRVLQERCTEGVNGQQVEGRDFTLRQLVPYDAGVLPAIRRVPLHIWGRTQISFSLRKGIFVCVSMAQRKRRSWTNC